MILSRPLYASGRLPLSATAAWVITFLLGATVLLGGPQNPPPPGENAAPAPAAKNPKLTVLPLSTTTADNDSDLAATRAEAAELSALAGQLRDELNKMNFNVLALDVLQKTEKVERLAKKIKGEATGNNKLNAQRPQNAPRAASTPAAPGDAN